MKGTARSRAFVSMVVLALLSLGVPYASAVTAQGNASPTVLDDPLTMNAETILAPEELGEWDQLGWSVAIDGDTAVAGAIYDNNDAGAVYVYERVDHEWVRSARLVSSDPGAYESFGCSVAIEGDTIVVGEFRDKESGVNKGAVHVFTRSGTVWSHAAKLVASPRVTNGEFGCDVAISGGAIAIGSYGYDGYEGGAYVFRGAGSAWAQEDVLPAPTPEAYNTGESIDIDGDTMLVGVQKDDGVASDAGAVYVYTRSGTDWQMRTTLTASDGAVSDYFGCSVALDGQLALIGAKADDDLGNWSGAAYLFRGAGATWTQIDKILPSDGAAQDEFGRAVSLDGFVALVGAQKTAQAGASTGRAYVFAYDGTGLNEVGSVSASNEAAGAYFGKDVAISGTSCIVGAYGASSEIDQVGRAYVYDSYYTVAEDEQLVLDPPGPLVNDWDFEGDDVRLWDWSDPAHGDVSAFSNGALRYTPDPDFNGYDSFTYIATDDISESTSATVSIRVTPTHDYIPIEGDDRFETGAAAALAGFGASGAPVAVIATGRNFPDALGGSALAGALDAPLLLVDTATVPSSVAEALDELDTDHAIILGGTAAVTEGVETQLLDAMGAGSTVDRVAGADRYGTARKVAARAVAELGGTFDGVAFVATGANFPDALAAGPIAAAVAMPIYLVSNTAGDGATLDAMVADGVSYANVLGGEAVVTTGTFGDLVSEFGVDGVRRLAGQNRYETAAEVATYGVTIAKLEWDGVGIATGEAFPDALTAGATLGRFRTVLVLSRPTALSSETETVLAANRGSIDDVRFFGGTSALSPDVRARVKQVIEAP